ncbi:tetratricopeptide repeat protein [Marine Group III euryarchaeote]|nr:tetratricopeptide repeat protein [Marine Group III euryarchaeote]
MDVIDLIEEGENFYENGDSSAAKSKFLKASLLAPEDPQIYNRLGMLEMSRASPDQARIFYQKACTLAPEVARYHMRLGDSLQRLSRYEDAIRSYATSLELEPRNAPAWNNRGFANFNINRWNEALRCYDESMKSDPTYAVAWYNYGYTLQLSGRLNDSKDYYQRAVDLDPSDKIAWNNLANVHYNQGLYERSIDLYKESLKLDEEYVIAVNNIGNALDHLHRYDESIYYHEKAIELDSTFHYAWMAKGRALTRLGRPEEGLKFIETSIELDSEDPDYHEALGRCFQSLGLYSKARKIINLGLSVDGQHVPCWVALGDINMDIGNTLQAMQCFDEAVRAQDVLSRSRMRDLDWIEKGRILQTAGVVHEGFRQYSNAISVAPGTGRPYFRNAKVLIDFNQLVEAQELIVKGLEIDSNSVTGKILLLKTLSGNEIINREKEFTMFKDNHIEAQTIIAQKIYELDPKLALEFLDTQNPKHYLLLSQCFFRMQNFTNSLLFANKFISSNPREISGFLNGGWISIEMENYNEASNFFDMALGIDDLCSEALYGKGLVMKKKGEDYSMYQHILSQIDNELVI